MIMDLGLHVEKSNNCEPSNKVSVLMGKDDLPKKGSLSSLIFFGNL